MCRTSIPSYAACHSICLEQSRSPQQLLDLFCYFTSLHPQKISMLLLSGSPLGRCRLRKCNSFTNPQCHHRFKSSSTFLCKTYFEVVLRTLSSKTFSSIRGRFAESYLCTFCCAWCLIKLSLRVKS